MKTGKEKTRGAERARLGSLDAFRGLAVGGMILVNQAIRDSPTFTQLRHADWNGITLADLVFPFFLFSVGISLRISLDGRRARGASENQLLAHVAKRSLLIVALGVLMHAFPFTHISEMRWPGVLQRIGICFGIAAVLYLYLSRAGIRWTILLLLFGYWGLMEFYPVPEIGPGVYEPGRNFAAYIDRLVFARHMWPWHPSWDPEGIVSTMTAIATTLFGVETGRFLRGNPPAPQRIVRLLVAGLLLALAGMVWNIWLPINKNIWTSSYVLFTAGVSLVVFGLLQWVVDVRGHTRVVRPLEVFGRNALLAYVGSGVLRRGMEFASWDRPDGTVTNFEEEAYRVFTAVAPDPRVSSLLFALAFAFVLYCGLWVMWKKSWIIRL